jgi:hypothetical protein
LASLLESPSSFQLFGTGLGDELRLVSSRKVDEYALSKLALRETLEGWCLSVDPFAMPPSIILAYGK